MFFCLQGVFRLGAPCLLRVGAAAPQSLGRTWVESHQPLHTRLIGIAMKQWWELSLSLHKWVNPKINHSKQKKKGLLRIFEYFTKKGDKVHSCSLFFRKYVFSSGNQPLVMSQKTTNSYVRLPITQPFFFSPFQTWMNGREGPSCCESVAYM